ncbi:hypothetical protein PPRY_a3289 [Pseudoalteromonas prydzensis ACAM 620]|nr:hypothetical protein [Pseudoalteromonas prydzensis ACAM 620]
MINLLLIHCINKQIDYMVEVRFGDTNRVKLLTIYSDR